MTSERRNNETRKANKPHIYFMNGWWRVSALSQPYAPGAPHMRLWNKAHLMVVQMNEDRRK